MHVLRHLKDSHYYLICHNSHFKLLTRVRALGSSEQADTFWKRVVCPQFFHNKLIAFLWAIRSRLGVRNKYGVHEKPLTFVAARIGLLDWSIVSPPTGGPLCRK